MGGNSADIFFLYRRSALWAPRGAILPRLTFAAFPAQARVTQRVATPRGTRTSPFLSGGVAPFSILRWAQRAVDDSVVWLCAAGLSSACLLCLASGMGGHPRVALALSARSSQGVAGHCGNMPRSDFLE